MPSGCCGGTTRRRPHQAASTPNECSVLKSKQLSRGRFSLLLGEEFPLGFIAAVNRLICFRGTTRHSPDHGEAQPWPLLDVLVGVIDIWLVAGILVSMTQIGQESKCSFFISNATSNGNGAEDSPFNSMQNVSVYLSCCDSRLQAWFAALGYLGSGLVHQNVKLCIQTDLTIDTPPVNIFNLFTNVEIVGVSSTRPNISFVGPWNYHNTPFPNMAINLMVNYIGIIQYTH